LRERFHSIAYVNVIPYHLAISPDDDRSALGQVAEKYGGCALFGVRVLLFAVGVGDSRHHIFQTVEAMKQLQILFDRQLRYTVGADRICGVVLCDRDSLRNTIYSTAGGDENNFAYLVGTTFLQQLNRVNDIGAYVINWIFVGCVRKSRVG